MLTIDFETYWDKDFSLSKMTTESYIRAPQFEVIGVSIKKDNGPIEWVSGDDQIIKQALLERGAQNDVCVAHNAAFDMAIMNWRYGIRPRVIVDTLSMSRPITGLSVGGSLRALGEYFGIGEKGTEVYNTQGKHRKDFTPEELERYGRYCQQDVNLTYQLLQKLLPLSTAQEMYLIDLTIRMFTEPVLQLNSELLETHLEKVKADKQALLDSVAHGDRSAFMSNDKFAELLRAEGVEPPTKVSEKTGKTAYAFAKTDAGFQALLDHPNERVQALASARLGLKSTLEETRTQAFLDIARRGPMPVMLNYYGAANTGRFCVTGDTQIMVLRDNIIHEIALSELKDDDLVWDGEEFVVHGGLVCRGEREVMEYQGIVGTPDHRVFVEENHGTEGPITLFEASLGGYTLEAAGSPVSPREQVDPTDSARRGDQQTDEGTLPL